jgi:hypothetical protein
MGKSMLPYKKQQVLNILNAYLEMTKNALILISLLFHSVAPSCFGICVPSSVRAELQADLGLWLIKFCVVCGYVFTVYRSGAY